MLVDVLVEVLVVVVAALFWIGASSEVSLGEEFLKEEENSIPLFWTACGVAAKDCMLFSNVDCSCAPKF